MRAATGLDGVGALATAPPELVAAAASCWTGRRASTGPAIGDRVVGAPVVAPQGRLVLAAWWAAPTRHRQRPVDLLDDVARSLSLALEREELERAQAEAETLRRSQRLQREFLSRLSHELRTPLTAIHGCVDTLRQPDVAWGEEPSAASSAPSPPSPTACAAWSPTCSTRRRSTPASSGSTPTGATSAWS